MKAYWQIVRDNNLRPLRFLLLYLLLAVLVSIGNVYTSWLTGSIGQASVASDMDEVVRILLIMAAVTAAKVIFSALATLLSARNTGKTAYRIRGGLTRHVTSVSYTDLSRERGGDLLSLYTNELEHAGELVSTDTYNLMMETVTLLVSVVFMLTINLWITLIFFALFPPFAWIQIRISKPIMEQRVKALEIKGELNSVLNDSLQNTSTVLAYSLETQMEERYQKKYQTYFEYAMRRVKSYVRLVVSGIMGAFLPALFLTTASAMAVASGEMSVGAFIAYSAIGGTANSWLTMLSQRLGTVRVKSAAAQRLSHHMRGVPEDTSGDGAVSTVCPEGMPALCFEDVAFAYEEGSPVLNGLSFSIQPGSKVALVGESGCGKSTVMMLMLGLYEADSGMFTIHGEDARMLPKQALRSAMAYVPQDCFLFPGTIGGNICCFEPGDARRLEEACRDAGILDFIQSLPDGFDTVLTESGENLSGGQRQRIAIARALYRDAPIVLLDEATSALDPATEAAILDMFYESMRGKTAVVVAHRLQSVTACDRILVIEHGTVVEDGDYEKLLKADGAFARLYARQKEESGDAE